MANKAREDLQFNRERMELKEKEIELAREKIQLLKNEVAEKDNQIGRLSNQLQADGLNYEKLGLELKQIEYLRGKESDDTARLVLKIEELEGEKGRLLEEIGELNEERDVLIQISNELRAEVEYREITTVEPMKRISISNISKISLDEPRNIPITPPSIIEVPELKERRGSLISMVRERKEREREEK